MNESSRDELILESERDEESAYFCDECKNQFEHAALNTNAKPGKAGRRQSGGTAMVARLAELLEDPGRAEALSKDEICALLGEVTVWDARLRTRLVELVTRDRERPGEERESDLLTVEQVAQRLAVTEQYVYELLKRGGLPFIRIGKYKHIRPEDLREWIDRRREGPLDGNVYFKYNTRHERRRISKDTKAAELDTGRVRGRDRR